MASEKQHGNAVTHDDGDRDTRPNANEPDKPGKRRGRARAQAQRPEAEAPIRRQRPEAQEINVVRPSRPRRRARESERPALAGEAQTGSPSTAARSVPGKGTDAAQPAARPEPADPWALPQSVRDRFLQERRRFYFADGTEAFRDRGRRLTTPSENTEVIRSLIEIAKVRGWSEIVVEGTERFRREAWQQGRAAALEVRGYRPTAPERAKLARTLTRKEITRELARHEEKRQLDLYAWEAGLNREGGQSPGPTPAEVREDPAHSEAGRDRRGLIVGTLVDHGRENYRFDPREEMSYFLQIKTSEGQRTIWGKDLERALAQSLTQPQVGDEIALRRAGAEKVTVQRRERDGEGRLTSERPIEARRIRWAVERQEFFEARAAAAEVVRDPKTDRRQAARERPELVGTFLQLRAAELAARRIRDPQDQRRFVELVREALAASVARGDPLQPVRLRDRAGRTPARQPPERDVGLARA